MRAVTFGELSTYSLRQPSGLRFVVPILGLALFWAIALLLLGWPAVALSWGIVGGTFLVLRPRYGLYAMLAAVVVITGGSGIPFIRAAGFMFRGIDDTLGAGGLLTFSPLECALGLILLGTLIQARRHRLRLGEFFWPLAFLTGIVLFGLIRGMSSGGDALTGFHEIRSILYILPVYFLTVNLVREPRHFYVLTVVLVLSVMALSAGALWTHFSAIRPGEVTDLDITFAHENALFAGLVVVLLAAMLVWARGWGLRALLLLPAGLALASIMVMKRRVGVLALDVGLVVMGLVLLRHNWRLFLVVLPVLIAVGIVYLSIYWDATGGMGQGARAFRSAIGQEAATEDLSSKKYRDFETLNVQANIEWQPYWGSGFGKPYIFPFPLPDLSGWWPFQRFIPHNTILWTWMKGGMLAFILTMALFGHAMMRGMALARRRLEPLLGSWAVAAAAAVPMVFLFAWYDLGLTSTRTLIVFALCLGLITVLGSLPEEGGGDDKAGLKVEGRPLPLPAPPGG